VHNGPWVCTVLADMTNRLPKAKDEAAKRFEELINSGSAKRNRSADRMPGTKGVRPRNASTLILLDGNGANARILMGRRNKNLKFMPGAMVFPGGSVDKHDGSVPAVSELTEHTQRRLIAAMRGKSTKRGARALGLAAVRELAEESGLLLGVPGSFEHRHGDWATFSQMGIRPNLDGLRLFSRAITPVGMPRRFDTWFFLARSGEIGFTPEGGFDPCGELEDLRWIKPSDALEAGVRDITRIMLLELMRRLEEDPTLDDSWPAPYYQTRADRFIRHLI